MFLLMDTACKILNSVQDILHLSAMLILNKCFIIPRAHARARGYVIGRGVYIFTPRAHAQRGVK